MHETEILTWGSNAHGPTFVGRCACRWTGSKHTEPDKARLDLNEHLRQIEEDAPRLARLEQEEEFSELLDYWAERGYKYALGRFASDKDSMTADEALNKAIEGE